MIRKYLLFIFLTLTTHKALFITGMWALKTLSLERDNPWRSSTRAGGMGRDYGRKDYFQKAGKARDIAFLRDDKGSRKWLSPNKILVLVFACLYEGFNVVFSLLLQLWQENWRKRAQTERVLCFGTVWDDCGKFWFLITLGRIYPKHNVL